VSVIDCVTRDLVNHLVFVNMDGNLGRKRDEVESGLESDVQTKNIMNWNTVSEQWEDVLKELVGNTRQMDRKEMEKAYVRVWRELKSQALVPCNDEKSPLLPYLCKAAENAKMALEQHEQEKASLLFRGKWKRKREALERRRKYLYDMSVTCAALELIQRKRQSRKNRTAMLHATTHSLTPPPPPYNKQMPQFKITSGTVTAEKIHSGQDGVPTDMDIRLRNWQDSINGSFQELKRVNVPSIDGFETVDEIEGSEKGSEGAFTSEAEWDSRRVPEENEERLIALRKQMNEIASQLRGAREQSDREVNRTTRSDWEQGEAAQCEGMLAQGQQRQATMTGTLTLHPTPRYEYAKL